jgi:hypothetical protein
MSDLTITTAGVAQAANSDVGINKAALVRVTPVLIAGVTDDGDVAFNATEIPKAVRTKGGTSMLTSITIIDKDGEAHDLDLIFMQVQTNIGVQGSPPAINDANLQAAKVIGAVNLDWSDVDVSVTQDSGSASIASFAQFSGNNQGFSPLIVQSEENSTSIYFTAIAKEGIAWAATDDVEFVFGFKYLS